MSLLDRDAARDAAREELSRPQYDEARPPLLQRLLGRVLRELLELLDRAATTVPGGRIGLLALLLLLALLVAVVLRRVGPLARRSGPPPVLGGGRALTAVDHRRLADEAAGRGEWAEAVRERLRAVVRELEARGVLDPRPGRTAGEVARDGGRAVPAVADDLRRGASVFDEVWYGGRPADEAAYAVLVQVDERVSGSRLAVG